jgi:hypothetical protein
MHTLTQLCISSVPETPVPSTVLPEIVNWSYILRLVSRIRCQRQRGEAGTQYRGPTMLHIFCLSRYYLYMSTVQIHPFRPSPGYSATDSQSFRFIVKIFSLSALPGGPKICFHWGLNTLLSVLNAFSRKFEWQLLPRFQLFTTGFEK